MSSEELLTKVDTTAGDRGDSLLANPEFQDAAKILYDRTFFNSALRKEWGDVPFGVVYGEESNWSIIWTIWKIEEQAKEVGLPVKVVAMPGVNHFVCFFLCFSSEIYGMRLLELTL